MAKNRAEFDIIGRVGKIKPFDNATRISICSNYRRQDAEGNWGEDPHWNEVVVFNKRHRDYIKNHISTGDLVATRGKLKQSSFTDKDGEERFTTDLIALDFSGLAKKQAEGSDS